MDAQNHVNPTNQGSDRLSVCHYDAARKLPLEDAVDLTVELVERDLAGKIFQDLETPLAGEALPESATAVDRIVGGVDAEQVDAAQDERENRCIQAGDATLPQTATLPPRRTALMAEDSSGPPTASTTPAQRSRSSALLLGSTNSSRWITLLAPSARRKLVSCSLPVAATTS